jgi:hypothetical protein
LPLDTQPAAWLSRPLLAAGAVAGSRTIALPLILALALPLILALSLALPLILALARLPLLPILRLLTSWPILSGQLWRRGLQLLDRPRKFVERFRRILPALLQALGALAQLLGQARIAAADLARRLV